MKIYNVTPQYERNLEEVKSTCEWLGIPLAMEKVVGPTTVLTFLGITLDTVWMVACLPPKKLDRIHKTIAQWLPKKKASYLVTGWTTSTHH